MIFDPRPENKGGIKNYPFDNQNSFLNRNLWINFYNIKNSDCTESLWYYLHNDESILYKIDIYKEYEEFCLLEYNGIPIKSCLVCHALPCIYIWNDEIDINSPQINIVCNSSLIGDEKSFKELNKNELHFKTLSEAIENWTLNNSKRESTKIIELWFLSYFQKDLNLNKDKLFELYFKKINDSKDKIYLLYDEINDFAFCLKDNLIGYEDSYNYNLLLNYFCRLNKEEKENIQALTKIFKHLFNQVAEMIIKKIKKENL